MDSLLNFNNLVQHVNRAIHHAGHTLDVVITHDVIQHIDRLIGGHASTVQVSIEDSCFNLLSDQFAIRFESNILKRDYLR